MGEHQLRVFVDYHQFYLWDAGTDPAAPEDFTTEDVERMVKVAPHVMVVQPARNNDVPVHVSVVDADPGFDPADYDHIVECSLDLPTGHLQVHECLGVATLDMHVDPGVYAARVLCKGLSSITRDALEGNDAYRIQLWPGATQELTVVKQWVPETA